MVSLAVYMCMVLCRIIHTKAKVNEGNFGHWGNDWELFSFQERCEASAK